MNREIERQRELERRLADEAKKAQAKKRAQDKAKAEAEKKAKEAQIQREKAEKKRAEKKQLDAELKKIHDQNVAEREATIEANKNTFKQEWDQKEPIRQAKNNAYFNSRQPTNDANLGNMIASVHSPRNEGYEGYRSNTYSANTSRTHSNNAGSHVKDRIKSLSASSVASEAPTPSQPAPPSAEEAFSSLDE